MKKFLLLIGLFAGAQSVEAQQLHFTSQYLLHNSMYNPAAAGLSSENRLGLSYRNMWNSFPGNPRTYMIYGDMELKKLSSGLAGYIYRDETGPTSRTGLQIAYSYHIRVGKENQKLALGLELRGLQYAVDKGKLAGSLGNDPVLGGSSEKIGIDAGAGAYYTDGKLSLGAAASQLIQSKLQLADVPNSQLGGKLYRHYNFMASYKWQTGADIFLIPNAMARVIENSPTEYDFGMKLDYMDKVWWGLNWRINQAWILQAGFKLFKRVGLTYSYDYYVTPISVFTSGSGAHEIGLQVGFKK